MHFFDHAYVILIAIVYPIVGFLSFRRLLRRVAAGEAVDRRQLYRHTHFGHWTLFIIVMTLWAWTGRSWAALGFGMEFDRWSALAAILAIAGIVFLLLQLRQFGSASRDDIDKIKARIGCMSILIPQNRGELVRFYGLSITAGIVEEVLWRGFLIWYLNQFMPLWAAAAISTIAFGLAHAYQGISHLPPIILAGAALSGLYVLSGSIWLCIVMHAAVDILQGRLAFDVHNRGELNGEFA